MDEIRIRIDKFLKQTRIIPRRVVAKLLIEQGRVLINDKVCKPSSLVKDNDLISIFTKGKKVVVKVSFELTGNRLLIKTDVMSIDKEDIPEC